MTKDAFINNIIGSFDVQEILCIKRVRLKTLVDTGKLIPVKILKGETLYWKPDVDALKEEMMKYPRSNLFKQKEEKKRA